MPSSPLNSLRDLAKQWVSSGLSVVPIKADGSKAPTLYWQELENRRLTDEEIDRHFEPGLGIAIIGGQISGGLEIIDFDIPEDCTCVYDEWVEQLDVDLLKLVGTMPLVKTAGGGRHLYYRCEHIEGSQKLAKKDIPSDKNTLIETRGEGGYVLAPGCPPKCHPFEKTYDLLHGDLTNIPTISIDSRAKLITIAKSFNEVEVKHFDAPQYDGYRAEERNRPGDDFNHRASWHDILEPEGWTFIGDRRSDGAQLWKRPGKEDRGISATVREIEGQELFHCFSSNSGVFPHDQSITKFTAYALLRFDGDYEAAARELGRQGYGEPPKSSIDLDTAVYCKRGDGVPWSDAPGPGARVYEDDAEIRDAPEGLPFGDEEPTSVSIWHKEIDPLEVQLFENEEKLQQQEEGRKKKRKAERRKLELARGPAYIIWRDFGDPPLCRQTEEGRIKVNAAHPRNIAWHLIGDRFADETDIRTIHYQHGEFMLWNRQRYRRLKVDDVRPSFSNFLSHCAEFDGMDKEDRPVYTPYKVKKSRIEEMVLTMKDMSHIDSDLQDPCWLCEGEEDLPDPREIVCCSNGLFDVKNKTLLPPTPAFYSFNSTGIFYNENAEEPKRWHKFLDDTLDKESQKLLQQWFGYCLVQDTRLQKMLMCVGKPGSGKGTAMTMLQELVGYSSVCSMDFDRINNNFALSVALGKSLMIFPDARQGYRMDSKGSVVGNILSITGEDTLLIDRKNMKPITQKLNTRIVVVSNDIINLSDASGALNRRMLWVKFPGFDGKEDPDLKAKLRDELSGILNWSIDGWHTLHETGQFTQPESAHDLMESFQEQASPIKRFMEDMCDVGADYQSPCGELFKFWQMWRKIMGYGKSTSNAVFGKMLLSADMSISRSRRRVDGNPQWKYLGISLNTAKVEETIANTIGQREWNIIRDEHAQKTIGDIIDMDAFKLRKILDLD